MTVGTSKFSRCWPVSTVEESLLRQSSDVDDGGWICPDCIFYQGGLHCELNTFIAFVGANMGGCWGFQKGKKCRHCGLVT